MVKILNATCLGRIVTAGDVVVPDCIILSEGLGASEGVVIISDIDAVYVSRATPDVSVIIDQLIQAVTAIQASLVLNDFGASSAPIVSGVTAMLTLLRSNQI